LSKFCRPKPVRAGSSKPNRRRRGKFRSATSDRRRKPVSTHFEIRGADGGWRYQSVCRKLHENAQRRSSITLNGGERSSAPDRLYAFVLRQTEDGRTGHFHVAPPCVYLGGTLAHRWLRSSQYCTSSVTTSDGGNFRRPGTF